MIRIKDHKQGQLFDPWSFFSPKRRQLLDQSWAGLFKEQILCELPVKNRNPIDSHYYWGQDAMKKPTKGHIGEDAPVRMSLRCKIYPKIAVNTNRSESKVLVPQPINVCAAQAGLPVFRRLPSLTLTSEPGKKL